MAVVLVVRCRRRGAAERTHRAAGIQRGPAHRDRGRARREFAQPPSAGGLRRGDRLPLLGGTLGWKAIGARTDTVGGRTVTTVFYTNSRARRIGYSIVAGDPLAIPVGSSSVERHGVSFHVISHTNPTIVTWREAGHTCILSARGVSAGTLMRLATWQRA